MRKFLFRPCFNRFDQVCLWSLVTVIASGASALWALLVIPIMVLSVEMERRL